MASSLLLPVPKHLPPADESFRPMALGMKSFHAAVKASGKATPLVLGLARGHHGFSVHRTEIFEPGTGHDDDNLRYADRVLKFLLWQKGGNRIVVGGPREVAEDIAKSYGHGGKRSFDAEFMARVYEQPFTVERAYPDAVPAAREHAAARGGHLDGNRIGLDLGASDRKVAAVRDGSPIHTEEVVWMPRDQQDPQWHVDQIVSALKSAGSKLPGIDAIGVSTAGVVINNRMMIASLFRGVPENLFNSRVKGIWAEVQRTFGGVPLEVANDGDVTALAGSMSLNDGAVIGIAMGSSLAAGYVTGDRLLTDWLSELAFAPVDLRPDAPADEWSGDLGVGVQYFSQVGAGRLAANLKIPLTPTATPAEKLKELQALHEKGDDRAAMVFTSVGCAFGYAIAQYAHFYDVRHVLALGRVTSGKGGPVIVEKAKQVLKDEFPELAGKINIHMPEGEIERRHGQAVAAASLPAKRG